MVDFNALYSKKMLHTEKYWLTHAELVYDLGLSEITDSARTRMMINDDQ